MPRPSHRLLSLALLAACGPDGPGATATETAATTGAGTTGMTGTTGTTGTTSAPEPTTSSDATTESPPTTTGAVPATTSTSTTDPVDDTTTADTTTTTTDDDTTGSLDTTDSTTNDIPDTTGGELCGNADEADVQWNLEVPPALVGQDIDASCKILEADVVGPDISVTLACTIQNILQELTLHYTVVPERDLLWNPDTFGHLTYRTEDAPWGREWLTLHTGLTDLWAVRADSLAPPGVTAEDYFERAVDLVPACDPLPDPCGMRQGLEVQVAYVSGDIDTETHLRSGQWDIHGFPIPTLVWVEHASRLLDPIECDGAAPVRLDMMLVDDASKF